MRFISLLAMSEMARMATRQNHDRSALTVSRAANHQGHTYT